MFEHDPETYFLKSLHTLLSQHPRIRTLIAAFNILVFLMVQEFLQHQNRHLKILKNAKPSLYQFTFPLQISKIEEAENHGDHQENCHPS